MSESIRRIFPGNNSTCGFYSYYEQRLEGMEQIYILKGGPGTGKSSLLKGLSERFRREGFEVEHWLCSSDPDSLDGLILLRQKVAVVDGTAPHIVEPRYPGAVETIVNLGDCWEDTILKQEKERIRALSDGITGAFATAYEYTAKIGQIDSLMQALQTETATAEVGVALPAICGGNGTVRPFFAMAMTPEGVLDLREELWQGYRNRLFLVGTDCPRRRRFWQELIATAIRWHLNCEVGYGAFDPGEPVFAAFPAFDLAVTAVEALPQRDLRQEDRFLVFEGKQTKALFAAEQKKTAAVRGATEALTEAHRLHDELEKIYIAAMDFSKVERLGKTVYENILNFAAKG